MLTLGRLPGDMLIARDNIAVVVPLGTMLLTSLLLTISVNLLARLSRWPGDGRREGDWVDSWA